MTSRRPVVILGTLDTKAREVDFVRQVVLEEGGVPLVIDTGVLGGPGISADIGRQEVAEAGGSSIEDLIAAGDKADALVVMGQGAARILLRLLEEERLGGVISLGGSRGTAVGTRAMQALPIGVPKLMVSTMASGPMPFGPYVGIKDITLMHSVADILGVNAVTGPVLRNAAAAITAMSRVGEPVAPGSRPTLAATMLGTTTPLVDQIRSQMKEGGYDTVAFHATGTGGRSMEELINQGVFRGVFDVTLTEIAAWLTDGPHSAGPGRMEGATSRGLPQVIAPGGLDQIIQGPPESVPPRYAGRKRILHTPRITVIRTSAQELTEAARIVAERLGRSDGPVAVVLPLRGFSVVSTEGQPLHDPQADRAFIETIKEALPSRVRIVELDTHINDVKVATAATDLMLEMLSDRQGGP